jgi:predicted phage tail protein
MKTVRLYGHLAKRMGKEFKFDINTPGQAISALRANFKAFPNYIDENKGPGYAIVVGKESKTIKGLDDPCSNREVIKIIPIYAGAGNILKNILTVIAGAALIAFAPYLAPAGGGGVFGLTAATAASLNTAVVGIGLSLALSGISGLLFAPPSVESTEKADNEPNFAFSGAVNTTQQGNPVPVGYGRLVVGSQVISAGLRVEDRGATDTPTFFDILGK